MCYHVYTMENMVGIRELRQHASVLLKRVANGESIQITDHGHPVAKLVPFRPGPLEQLVLEGRASQPVADLLELAKELGLPQRTGGLLSVSAALEEMRSDDR